MNPPSRKTLPKLAGELDKYVIPNHIIRMYDGKVIDDGIDSCERCGSKHLQRHGTKERLFCKVILESDFKDVYIRRRVYRCVHCHHDNVSGKDLFYDGCEYARPIVDECLSLAAHNPANRVESMMLEKGLQIDARTVLRYIKQFKLKIIERNPLKVGDADVGVNLVKALFGKETIEDLEKEFPDEKFAGVGDETYPRARGALEEHSANKRIAEAVNGPLAIPEAKKKAPKGRRKKNGKNAPQQGSVKVGKFPESFTLALAYISTLKFYCSLICTVVSFNSLLAEALFKPLQGVICVLTDGSPIYNGLADDRCFFHYMMNFFKKDPGLANMKRGKPPPPSSIIAPEYMHDLCQLVRAEYLRHLMEKHPELVVKDEENGGARYIGPTTTSAMEGGNHRIKYELRVPYSDTDTICGRAILIAVRDSMYTFRHGKPEESFAHVHSSFTYGSVMAAGSSSIVSPATVIPSASPALTICPTLVAAQ